MPHQHSELVELPPITVVPLEAKSRVPVARPGSVSRTPLVNRLRAAGSRQVVTVLAPAGYGKTTVLAQWAERDGRLFVWVSIDEDDDDPISLARRIASGLRDVQPVDPGSPKAPGPHSRSAAQALRRLTAAAAAAPDPFVLVLDNIHLLRSRRSVQLVATLAEHVPHGSTLVLAGRTLPRLPIARMRAAGRLFEVGVDQLALSHREISLVMRSLGVELEASELAELADRTEGWAAGAYLAALSLKDGGPSAGRLRCVRGDDRFVVDYFDFEHLSRLSQSDVSFLTRTAVLERMSGPLCDAMLDSAGSARKLESIATANLFVVPLDRRREWYRYHHEFRGFLLAELERREPELLPELHRRAAAWSDANGAPEAAISHAHAAGETEFVAHLIAGLALPMCSSGRAASVDVWLDWFDVDGRLVPHPMVAAVGAWVHLLRGRPAAAKRWMGVAEHGTFEGVLPDSSPSLEPWFCVLRAAMCRDGVEQMRADAEIALRDLGAASQWRPAALLLLGVAQLLLEASDCGDESLEEAAEAAESAGATDIRIVALAERSLLAAARGADADAEALAARARALVEGRLAEHPLSAIALAASARQSLRTGDLVRARADLSRARTLATQLTNGIPWLTVQTNLEVTRADLALLDASGAATALSDATEILRRVPRLGVLTAQADRLRPEVARAAELSDHQATLLTTAELRLLPLLTTHLSFREIGERLCVSRSTVKTQAISVYRKFVVSSRSEAIARAVELGLVESRPVEFNPSG